MLSVLLSLALVQEIPSRVRTPEPPPPPPPPVQDEAAAKTDDLDAAMRALLEAQDAIVERKPAPSPVEVPEPPPVVEAPVTVPVPPAPPAPQDDNADLDAAAAALHDAQEAIREKRQRESKPLGVVPGAPTSDRLLKDLVDAVKDQPPIPPKREIEDPTLAGDPPQKVGPSPEEVLSLRARQDSQRAKAEAEAMRLLAGARVRRAQDTSALFADAARPLELPLRVEALPPIKDLKNYPLYIPRHARTEFNLARTDETDILYYEHRAYVAHEREMLDERTAQRRETAAAESNGYEEAWADQILRVKSALAGGRR